jgi:hypothetical protein
MNLIHRFKALLRKYGALLCPFLLIFGTGFLFYYFPYKVIPDYANIKDYSKIYELFNLIITSLVSLVGIYISVSLVAYEFFKQKSGIDFHKSFLVNTFNSYYVSFSVQTIIFTFILSILISTSNPDWNEVSLIYYNAILFLLVIGSLFFVAFNLFSSLKPEKLANEELSQITRDTILIRTAENDDIDKQAAIIEDDHLVKIESIVIALVAVSDNIKAQAIIQKATIKLSNLIIDESNLSNKEYITKRLISFYIKVIDYSLLQPNNSIILKSIWLAVDRMYSVILNRKETVKHFEAFRKEFFERYFNRLMDNNKEEMIFEGIATIRMIIQNQVLFNMAADNKIHYFNGFRRGFEKDFKENEDYSDYDFKNSDHWREVAIETMESITFLVNKAIYLNKPDLLNKCFEQINDLNFQLHLKGAGIYKQCFFYINCSNIISDYTFRAYEKSVFIEGHDAKHLTPSLFENLIEEMHPAARTVLQKYCCLLINLQKIGKLDRWFLGGLKIGEFLTTEGDLGGIAKRCAIEFHKGKEIQDCLEDCISTFKIIKEYYESHPPENFGLYSVIKWQFENILDWMEKKQSNEVVTNELKKIVASFKDEL